MKCKDGDKNQTAAVNKYQAVCWALYTFISGLLYKDVVHSGVNDACACVCIVSCVRAEARGQPLAYFLGSHLNLNTVQSLTELWGSSG